jgi:hypothetical protein
VMSGRSTVPHAMRRILAAARRPAHVAASCSAGAEEPAAAHHPAAARQECSPCSAWPGSPAASLQLRQQVRGVGGRRDRRAATRTTPRRAIPREGPPVRASPPGTAARACPARGRSHAASAETPAPVTARTARRAPLGAGPIRDVRSRHSIP